MFSLSPHINFNGNAEEAFTFYKSIFGGEFTQLVRFKELASGEFVVDPVEGEKIMHIALSIGNMTLFGNDVPSFMGKTNERENRSKIFIRVESHEEANRILQGLLAGGEIEVPCSTSPWGSYFGMGRDKYGIEWIVESIA